MKHYIYIYIYIYTWKKFQKRRQPKITIAVSANSSFDIGLVLAILRRVLTLIIILSRQRRQPVARMPTFFPDMIYI